MFHENEFIYHSFMLIHYCWLAGWLLYIYMQTDLSRVSPFSCLYIHHSSFFTLHNDFSFPQPVCMLSSFWCHICLSNHACLTWYHISSDSARWWPRITYKPLWPAHNGSGSSSRCCLLLRTVFHTGVRLVSWNLAVPVTVHRRALWWHGQQRVYHNNHAQVDDYPTRTFSLTFPRLQQQQQQQKAQDPVRSVGILPLLETYDMLPHTIRLRNRRTILLIYSHTLIWDISPMQLLKYNNWTTRHHSTCGATIPCRRRRRYRMAFPKHPPLRIFRWTYQLITSLLHHCLSSRSTHIRRQRQHPTSFYATTSNSTLDRNGSCLMMMMRRASW